MTWKIEFIATSESLIGVPSWSRARRWPGFWPQKVWWSLLPGSGPSVDSGASTAMGRAARAATIAVTMTGRRPMPVSARPLVIISAAALRVSSEPRTSWRSSTHSSSGMSVLAQCTAAAPMKNTAIARPRPVTRLDHHSARGVPSSAKMLVSSGVTRKYAAMKMTVPTTLRRNMKATSRSARFSAGLEMSV